MLYNKNHSCLSAAEDTASFLVCVLHVFEEWAGVGQMEDYLSVLDYLLWVFTPLAIVFILPFLLVILLYLSILFLHVYKRKNQLREAYSNNLWDGARKTLATIWDGHGAIWHGYEIYGMEKVPEKGPALIVYYHGAIPVDYYYFLARVIIQKGRTCHSVADHFLFKIPGFKLLLEVFSVIHGPQEECVRALRSGHLLGISPGGVREALFSDETYPLLWGKRRGFAQVAIDSQVPIIPMFTQNVREGFRSLGTLKFFRWVYERFRLPIAPIYGGFPVKFRTFLGDPIPYDPNVTAAELADKCETVKMAGIDEWSVVQRGARRATHNVITTETSNRFQILARKNIPPMTSTSHHAAPRQAAKQQQSVCSRGGSPKTQETTVKVTHPSQAATAETAKIQQMPHRNHQAPPRRQQPAPWRQRGPPAARNHTITLADYIVGEVRTKLFQTSHPSYAKATVQLREDKRPERVSPPVQMSHGIAQLTEDRHPTTHHELLLEGKVELTGDTKVSIRTTTRDLEEAEWDMLLAMVQREHTLLYQELEELENSLKQDIERVSLEFEKDLKVMESMYLKTWEGERTSMAQGLEEQGAMLEKKLEDTKNSLKELLTWKV